MEIPLHDRLEGEASYKRRRIDTEPIADFRPRQGDIIIHEIRHPSPTPLNLNGKLEVYTDELDSSIKAVNIKNKQETFFVSGDLLLRHGCFSPNFKWEFATQATLYLFRKAAYEQLGKWYKVADAVDTVNNRGVVKPDWAGFVPRGSSSPNSLPAPTVNLSNALNSFGIFLYRGDYIITERTNQDNHLPLLRNFILNIIPSTYDARRSGRDFGQGDVLVRTIVTEEPGNIPEKSIIMEAHGIFNMGGFVDWTYMGRQDVIFKKSDPGDASSSRARSQGPVLPGDIIFNLDLELHDATTSVTWMGGHIMIQPDGGPLPNRPEDLPRSMLLRLGSFETDPPPYWDRSQQYWRWVDDAMEMYIQDVAPESWSKKPLNVMGNCPGGMFPLCNSEFESVNHIPDRPIRIGSRANIVPTETDIIYRFSLPPGAKNTYERNGMDEKMWEMFVRSDNLYRHHNLFFWRPGMRTQPTDHLIRFGSQPAEPGQGQWILGVELYECAMTEPGLPTMYSDWRLRGRDVVIFPSSSPRR